MSTEHKLILHDEEICIYDYDMECLQDGRWLRDTILYFQIRVFERKYSDLFKNHYFKIFYPQVAQILQSYPFEMAKQALPHDDIKKYKLIFFPLSDFNPATQSATHWSLLYIDNRNGDMQLKHFDSRDQTNRAVGQRLAKLFGQLYDFNGDNVELLQCSMQDNTYDCGIYVLSYIDALIEKRGDHEAANAMLTPSYTHSYRVKIREYIPERAKEIENQKK